MSAQKMRCFKGLSCKKENCNLDHSQPRMTQDEIDKVLEESKNKKILHEQIEIEKKKKEKRKVLKELEEEHAKLEEELRKLKELDDSSSSSDSSENNFQCLANPDAFHNQKQSKTCASCIKIKEIMDAGMSKDDAIIAFKSQKKKHPCLLDSAITHNGNKSCDACINIGKYMEVMSEEDAIKKYKEHQREKLVSCRYGSACTKKDCTFAH